MLRELTKWNLKELYSTFRHEGVTKELVWDYTLEELKEMNVKPTQRKKYIQAINKMKMEKEGNQLRQKRTKGDYVFLSIF